MSRPSSLTAALLLGATLLGPAASAAEADRDPRNWPPLSRLVVDRYEIADQVISLRVHARESAFYGCGYRHERGRLMAFSLMGGPLETLTGYVPRQLGEVLARQLREEPWMPITVQVRFDPEHLSDLCPDQVEVLKWANGWQYPPGTLTPGRPDPTFQPTRQSITAADQRAEWAALTGRRPVRRRDRPPLTEEALLGQTLSLTAGARLSTAYHCAYRSATRTHYAVRLHDGKGGFVHAYLRREARGASELMDLIGLHRDILIEINALVVKQIPSNYCQPQLELISWRIPGLEPEPDAP